MKIEDYTKYYIQGSDHYLIPKDVFKELFNEMVNWKEESQKQKEVIEEVREYIEREDICIDIRDNELNYISTNDLLQILDKPKGEMNNE